MEQILCVYCGDLFDASPRHKNQIACKKTECQRAKKADWQRHKMKIDTIYNANQKINQKEWVRANPGYWKEYRKNNPEKAERNRILQAIRNRKARSTDSDAKMDTSLIAKMDASKIDNFQTLGQFWMVPVIAKMDALKVNIVKIPICYP
ncbi:MAG: hypothetical protein U9N53_05720 [Bacteroidota bacterium]|nr:hypothetical protein [Bacteroidota bacterium]